MRFLPFILANLWHKRVRTILTFLSVFAAFVLFGLLQGMSTAFETVIERSNVNRLIVTSKVSFTDFLPYTYLAQLERIPGVTAVSHQTWLGASYQDSRNVVAAFAVEPDRFAAVNTEFHVPPDQRERFAHLRTGVLVGAGLAKKYHWKLGDRIPLRSSFWSNRDGTPDWTFDIVGIYSADNPGNENRLFLNYQYFDEARTFGRGTTGWYVVTLQNPRQAARIAESIDQMFLHESTPTETKTEKEFQQSFIRQNGDINYIVSRILVAVLTALLFATASSLMQSTRERTKEFGILKAIGFSDTGLLVLVFTECVVVCVGAAILGLATASVIFSAMRETLGVVGMPTAAIGEGIIAVALLALITGFPAAWRARQLSVVDALGGRA